MRNLKNGLIFIRLFTLCSMISGCGGGVPGDTVGNVDFSRQNTELYLGDPALYSASQTLLSNRCNSCHRNGSRVTPKFNDIMNTEHLVRTGMIIPGDASVSPVHIETSAGRMPQGQSLTPSEIQLLADWINSMSFVSN